MRQNNLANSVNARGQIEWVPINQIMENPLNPRRDSTIRTAEMQKIIMERGWEEPLTVYQKGQMYVLLAGHRRLYAARKCDIKEVPVFVVEQPENYAQEIERIASLQSGRVNFTQWEWGKFTYERWIAWDKPPINRFAKQINLPRSTVKEYIKVFEFFPRNEIESGLVNKSLTFKGLVKLISWLQALDQHKPLLVHAMTEDMIRKMMIEKMINKKVSAEALQNKDYVEMASEEDIKNMLINREVSLDKQMGDLGLEQTVRNFNGHLISIGLMEKRLPTIYPKTERQKELAIHALEELQEKIKNQMNALKNQSLQ